MVNRLKKIMSLSLILLLFSLNGCNSTNKDEQLSDRIPKDFSFVFNYGVNAKNQLNSLKGQYTKDMITEPSVTTDLLLSDEEINIIYSEMRKINILNYSEDFKPESDILQTPFITYSIKIVFDGKEKSIYWEDENVSETKEAIQLRELFKRIQEIIINKEEYQKLPPAEGGYD